MQFVDRPVAIAEVPCGARCHKRWISFGPGQPADVRLGHENTCSMCGVLEFASIRKYSLERDCHDAACSLSGWWRLVRLVDVRAFCIVVSFDSVGFEAFANLTFALPSVWKQYMLSHTHSR